MRSTAILLCVLLLAACKKEDLLRHKYSGVYTVDSYERIFFDSTGTSSTINDYGTLGLYDNDNNPYNNVTYQLAGHPDGWHNNYVEGPAFNLPVGWYTDDVDGSTITFFSTDEYTFYYAIYTVEHEGGKKYTWTYVQNNAGNEITYKEVWSVTRK